MTRDHEHIALFEAARPRLMGIAYRILGSRADAEDAVQDTGLRWLAVDGSAILRPEAWLVTACTRRAIDMLRAAYRSRVDYTGDWLPEPVVTDALGHDQAGAEVAMIRAASLSTAFMLVLERLSPRERAAYLLYEIFEMPYAELAAVLEASEPACRQLVTRARARIGRSKVRAHLDAPRKWQLLRAFQAALGDGRPDALLPLLADDLRLTADGGGKAAVFASPAPGAEAVALLTGQVMGWWAGYMAEVTGVNGEAGLVLRDRRGIVAAVTCAVNAEGRIDRLFIIRNPDKLASLGAPPLI